MTTKTEQIYTFQELWAIAAREAKRPLSRSTFTDWLNRVTGIGVKNEYTEQDLKVLAHWIEFQSRYLWRSSAKVREYHQYIGVNKNG